MTKYICPDAPNEYLIATKIMGIDGYENFKKAVIKLCQLQDCITLCTALELDAKNQSNESFEPNLILQAQSLYLTFISLTSDASEEVRDFIKYFDKNNRTVDGRARETAAKQSMFQRSRKKLKNNFPSKDVHTSVVQTKYFLSSKQASFQDDLAACYKTLTSNLKNLDVSEEWVTEIQLLSAIDSALQSESSSSKEDTGRNRLKKLFKKISSRIHYASHALFMRQITSAKKVEGLTLNLKREIKQMVHGSVNEIEAFISSSDDNEENSNKHLHYPVFTHLLSAPPIVTEYSGNIDKIVQESQSSREKVIPFIAALDSNFRIEFSNLSDELKKSLEKISFQTTSSRILLHTLNEDNHSSAISILKYSKQLLRSLMSSGDNKNESLSLTTLASLISELNKAVVAYQNATSSTEKNKILASKIDKLLSLNGTAKDKKLLQELLDAVSETSVYNTLRLFDPKKQKTQPLVITTLLVTVMTLNTISTAIFLGKLHLDSSAVTAMIPSITFNAVVVLALVYTIKGLISNKKTGAASRATSLKNPRRSTSFTLMKNAIKNAPKGEKNSSNITAMRLV